MQHILCLTKEDITSQSYGYNFLVNAGAAIEINLTRAAAEELAQDIQQWLERTKEDPGDGYFLERGELPPQWKDDDGS